MWVMIDLKSSQTKKSFLQHVRVASWFLNLRNAQLDFVPRDCIVWVDVEGVPLHGWTSATFSKIGPIWRRVLILKKKSLSDGKVFIIRAKRIISLVSAFQDIKEVEYNTDDESVKGSGGIKGDANIKSNLDANSDDEKQDERKNVVESDTSISHPPGFTQEKMFPKQSSKSLNKGGSILDALDDMIKVGQIMGYDMDGCVKDMERIIGSQGVNEVLQ
ncbi:hypothetical protein Tco_0520682 [Tanacetum coccineum]